MVKRFPWVWIRSRYGGRLHDLACIRGKRDKLLKKKGKVIGIDDCSNRWWCGNCDKGDLGCRPQKGDICPVCKSRVIDSMYEPAPYRPPPLGGNK